MEAKGVWDREVCCGEGSDLGDVRQQREALPGTRVQKDGRWGSVAWRDEEGLLLA